MATAPEILITSLMLQIVTSLRSRNGVTKHAVYKRPRATVGKTSCSDDAKGDGKTWGSNNLASFCDNNVIPNPVTGSTPRRYQLTLYDNGRHIFYR